VRSVRFLRLSMAALAVGVVLGVHGHASAFEDPPVANATTLLGAQAKGPNYTVCNSDGRNGREYEGCGKAGDRSGAAGIGARKPRVGRLNSFPQWAHLGLVIVIERHLSPATAEYKAMME
jgi:hypothetical protein